jgi:uncharacterized glyoxalase superfamily protein PhnB
LSDTPRLTLMNPVLFVSDMERALTYYTDVLGFDVSWRFGEPTVRAAVARDGHELQLDQGSGRAGGASLYFHVVGVDAYYAACCERGAHVEREIGDQFYKARDFTLSDPDGNSLGFGEPMAS